MSSEAFHPALHTMSFSAILLDLDGTLLDTIADLTAASNAMRQDMDRPVLTQEIVAGYVGKGVEQLVARVLNHGGEITDPTIHARALACYREHYRTISGQAARPYPGVIDGLRAFRAQGARLAVVTNKGTEFTLPLLKRMNLAQYFDAVVCGDTCARRKPDPMPLLYACDLLRVRVHDALFIGDSINDALAAQAAGMRCLAVPYGYNEGRPANTLPVDAVVPSLIAAAQWASQPTAQTEDA